MGRSGQRGIDGVAIARLGFRRDPAQATLFGMASIFANTGYMGIALFAVAFGPDGTLPAVVTTVVMAAMAPQSFL